MTTPLADEAAARAELAACYRLAARAGLDDGIYAHISLRVPGHDDHFLINPFGLHFAEITASTLAKVDAQGELLDDPTGLGINRAGFVIHSAIHQARPDLHCVMHTHTVAGMTLAASADGLLPLSQHAMRFHERIGYHDYEGIAVDLDERARLARDLGPHNALVLRNHGLITAGPDVAHAYDLMVFLERAAEAQWRILAAGAPLALPSPEAARRTAELFAQPRRSAVHRSWAALLRELERAEGRAWEA
ncbi:class II aldolase/adducin family protein [Bordetella sp. N]|uniref:class II aldolase/adducin family protein n=1 Tax=Bordetella sp. N TaxID=1746199 RepID=UPI00070C5368|nr:class II aldolase/adducin family protein [Bordetella sp. N]ALM86291.1 class II aldolase [Bordetella sp. N]